MPDAPLQAPTVRLGPLGHLLHPRFHLRHLLAGRLCSIVAGAYPLVDLPYLPERLGQSHRITSWTAGRVASPGVPFECGSHRGPGPPLLVTGAIINSNRTALDPETEDRWRLKGEMYANDFNRERLDRAIAETAGVQTPGDPGPDRERAQAARRELAARIEERAAYHRARYGGGDRADARTAAQGLAPGR